jgi:hypothetical protein
VYTLYRRSRPALPPFFFSYFGEGGSSAQLNDVLADGVQTAVATSDNYTRVKYRVSTKESRHVQFKIFIEYRSIEGQHKL